MDNIEALDRLYPNIFINTIGFKGFNANGWVVWMGHPKEYLVNPGEWTTDKTEATVFDCIETAVAVCESYQYFTMNNSPRVARASKEPE